MKGARPVAFVAALGLSLLAVALGASAVPGLAGSGTGRTHFVEIVQTDSSGVLAGLVTETEEGPLGLTSQTHPAEGGWVIAHPENVEASQTVRVVDDVPFEDPNGGMWSEHEVLMDGETAWAVPVDQARHDPTLEAAYNFALVVDWDQAPGDLDLTTSYVEELELVAS